MPFQLVYYSQNDSQWKAGKPAFGAQGIGTSRVRESAVTGTRVPVQGNVLRLSSLGV